MSAQRIAYFSAGIVAVTLLALAAVLAYELTTFKLEAQYLSRYAAKMTMRVGSGPSGHIRFPQRGPADSRMGYVALPDFSRRLQSQGFALVRQARISPAMQQMADWGLNLPYHERTQAGLRLVDETGETFYFSPEPQRQFADFQSIPPVLRSSLLFIENHELLADHPRDRNPAVEWLRLVQAVLDKLEQQVLPNHDVPGGSTLATQIEKFRHSNNGLTLTMRDKWQQMASASVRAYLDGPDTTAARKRLVLDYLNAVPLSAAPGYGEVVGLPDGMWAWYGLDYRQLAPRLQAGQYDAATGSLYKHALSLLIAQRKPSYYLTTNRQALDNLTDFYLRLLARKHIIPAALRDVALQTPLTFNPQRSLLERNFVEQKAVNAQRAHLAGVLGLPRLYDLDRLDLTAHTALNAQAQSQVSTFLLSMNDPKVAADLALYGHNLLTKNDDLRRIMYSFTLYERIPQGAALRIQVDSLNQPFDINRGAKLDLGSTSKMRTLISYLEIVTTLHDQFQPMDEQALHKLVQQYSDPIADWAIAWYIASPDRSLSAMLNAAMARPYSANPNETFFTAGGLHHFVNFDKNEDHLTMDLWQATRDSVNLVYIRLMRDIERYYIAHLPGVAGRVLQDVRNPARRSYLEWFADREGQEFMLRFYKKYRGFNTQQVDEKLIQQVHPSARRLAAVYRYLAPTASPNSFNLFVRSRADNWVDDHELDALYRQFAPGSWSLTDLGYIVQIHPLELWLAGYLHHHQGADFKQAVDASHPQRIAVYSWLFHTGRKNTQDVRIRSLLEVEAFELIHQDWKRLGYPFDSLVPSYATSLGVSADRPAALAHLMGIVMNNGVSLPEVSLQQLDFAKGTPYESVFVAQTAHGQRLLPVELTQVVRQALQGVVQSGTAVRMHDAFHAPDGALLAVGGKTGTGDHRFDTFDNKGNVLTSKVVDRTATMVFFIGDRFFGTMTAVVHGEAAGQYHFTSALPAQLIKDMSPWLLAPLYQSGAVFTASDKAATASTF